MNIKQDYESEVIRGGKTLIGIAIGQLLNKNYEGCYYSVMDAQKLFQQEKASEYISACLSIIGLTEYLKDKSKYLRALTYINDGTYLANYTQNVDAKLINEFVLGDIDYAEGNLDTAMLHYEKALKFGLQKDEYQLVKIIKERVHQLQEEKLSTGKRDNFSSFRS